MIQITETEVYGFPAAIRGMRNPKNSWSNSDSWWASADETGTEPMYIVGEKDLELMRKLAATGTDHRKFMRMVSVTADITAPLYWWKEYDTYKVGTVANSCSTMHKIHSKVFSIDDFSHEHLMLQAIPILEQLIVVLNANRSLFIETKDKDYWWQMIQLLPSSYNQNRTVMLNYEVLANMYHSRKDHKLDEWREFCGWIKTLPYAELITGNDAIETKNDAIKEVDNAE